MGNMLSGAAPGMPGETPNADASLNGTLSSQQVMSQIQAELARQQAARAAAVNEATGAANKAGIEYQQATQAPAPQVDPMTRLMTTMGGDVASIMSRNPTYAAGARSNVDQMHADLVQNRVQNLQSLRDVYDKRAQQAAQMGNADLEAKSREQIAKLDAINSKLLEDQRATAQQALEKLRGENALRTEQEKGTQARLTQQQVLGGPTAPGADGSYGGRIKKTDSGIPYVDTTEEKLPKAVQGLMNLAHTQTANGNFVAIAGPKEHQVLGLIKNVKMDLESVFARAQAWLPTSASDPRRMTLGIEGLTNPIIKAWPSERMAAIKQVSAMMTGGTGGRMNQHMIDLAIQNDIPDTGGLGRPSDWQGSAEQKKANLMDLFSNYEQAILNVPGAQDALVARLARDARSGQAAGTEAGTSGKAPKSAAAPVNYDDLEAKASARKKKG